MPSGWSSSTPTHWPLANSVVPQNRRVPGCRGGGADRRGRGQTDGGEDRQEGAGTDREGAGTDRWG